MAKITPLALNVDYELITDTPQRRQQLAQLNLTAGNKAKASTAYDPALKYLTMGINCLEASSWQQQFTWAGFPRQSAQRWEPPQAAGST